MKKLCSLMALPALILAVAAPVRAQSADEIVEKHLTATGGRGAMGKLQSRTSTGSITVTTPVGDLAGTIDVFAKAPNKTRTLIKIDLSGLGGGQVIQDQRFDGTTGYVIDSFNGNRDITGDQLEAIRTQAAFPTPFLNYKEKAVKAEVKGKDKIGAADVFVLQFTPATGPVATVSFDANTFMLVRTVVTVDVPQLGGPVEQVVDYSDFRDVDGVKVPFTVKSSNPAQTVTISLMTVTHNTEIDDASFAKPAQ